ncbi:MAG: hypothetical protein JSS62_01025 [Verrucomicrobia bacterium]|nr:hypothetical protein [Verrucomicrobiota bacterium]MBS0645269.1 hypothetical protein [Verrucomicrobiota bacterium]
MHSIKTPNDVSLCYLGPKLEHGPMPAVIYFSLCAKESLSLPPYNQPATFLQNYPLRIFSFTIPGHGEGFDKFRALDYWAQQMMAGHDLLSPFFEQTAHSINWLVDQHVILPHAVALAGLSRGAFVATHVATHCPHASLLLGFAPMTCVSKMTVFNQVQRDLSTLDLISIIAKLDHIKHIRCYIGNRDTLVGTKSCFEWTQALVEHHHTQHLKHSVELFLTPSIGHHGHGTSTEIFAEGSSWLKHYLLEQ